MITTIACVTESMYLLPEYPKVQNELLLMVSQSIIECEHVTSLDFSRIAEINVQYAEMKPDFADLALVAVSERLDVGAIATLDKDFDVYRRYRKQPFERIFRPS